MRPLATTTFNPMRRSGQSGFSICSMCGNQYTVSGIGRHWAHCRKKGHCYKHDEGLCECKTECFMQGKRVTL